MKCTVAWVAFICSATLATEVWAQSTDPVTPADKNFPTTLQSVNPAQYFEPRKKKKKKSKKLVTYDAKNDYYDRLEDVWRDREKREKSLERGEGTDIMKPPYFGHKKPPKIRAIEKRKYCKICGIRH